MARDEVRKGLSDISRQRELPAAIDHLLLMPLDQKFWSRTRPGRHIFIQRFVAPGYHITGKVTALIDSDAVALTMYHPDSGTHNEWHKARVGLVIFSPALGSSLLVRRATSEA